jgi:hypothetical protein
MVERSPAECASRYRQNNSRRDLRYEEQNSIDVLALDHIELDKYHRWRRKRQQRSGEFRFAFTSGENSMNIAYPFPPARISLGNR